MKRRVVIADAGPLIALARIDALVLLRKLFGRVYITPAVRDEVLPAAADFPETHLLTETLLEGWIEVAELPDDDWTPINPGVDIGEASAIHLAHHWRNSGDTVLLVIDDRAGRLEARAHDIPLVGTAALIGLAKTEELIPAAKPLLERLTQSGYYIGETIIASVLANVGE
jgi:predicted nucleic acid-binding protein